MDIRDLARLAEFEIDTVAFGRVRAKTLKVSDMDAAEHARIEDNADAEAVARLLFSRLAYPLESQDGDLDAEEEFTVHFNGEALLPSEVEQFAEELGKQNRYLAKTPDGKVIQNDAAESHAAFLLRLMDHYRATQREQWEKLMRPVTSHVFGDTTRSAWAQSILAAEKLESTVKAIRAKKVLDRTLEFRPLPRIEHPMRGTNDRLDTLVERLDQYSPVLTDTAAAILALERTVREMQANFASNSADADRRMFRTEVVAIISVFFTALGFATSTYFSNKQVNDDSVVKALHAIRTEHQADREALATALRQLAESYPAKVPSVVPTALPKKLPEPTPKAGSTR